MADRPVMFQNTIGLSKETKGSFSAHVSQLTQLPEGAILNLLETLPAYQSQSSPHTNAHLKTVFNELVLILSEQERLGSALSDLGTKAWLEQLFCSFLADASVCQLLEHLRDWDAYSYYHSIDVFLIGTLLAKQQGLKHIEDFALGCLLHDVGKRLIPQIVLSKKSKLTESEFLLVQQHASFGSVWLDLLDFPKSVSELALLHHERLNGSGYPQALTQTEIREEWRLIAVVDVYSALTLKRTYREPVSSIRALEIILSDHEKLYAGLTYGLADTLQIFPPQAELVLANGERATTILKNERLEDGCLLKIRETGNLTSFSSLQPKESFKMLGWKSHRLEQWQKHLWSSFIHGLVNKDPKTVTYFEELADGKRVEEIYREILGKMGVEVRELFLKGELSNSKRNIAIQSALQIMNQKLVEYAPSYRLSIDQGIVFLPLNEDHTFPLRLLHDLLFVNGWKTYFLKSDAETPELMEDRLRPIITKPFIHYLALSLTHTTDIWLLNHLIYIAQVLKPDIKIVLYFRSDTLLKEIDPSLIYLHANDLNDFLSFLNK